MVSLPTPSHEGHVQPKVEWEAHTLLEKTRLLVTLVPLPCWQLSRCPLSHITHTHTHISETKHPAHEGEQGRCPVKLASMCLLSCTASGAYCLTPGHRKQTHSLAGQLQTTCFMLLCAPGATKRTDAVSSPTPAAQARQAASPPCRSLVRYQQGPGSVPAEAQAAVFVFWFDTSQGSCLATSAAGLQGSPLCGHGNASRDRGRGGNRSAGRWEATRKRRCSSLPPYPDPAWAAPYLSRGAPGMWSYLRWMYLT